MVTKSREPVIVCGRMSVCKVGQGVEVEMGLAYDLPAVYVAEVPERGVGSSFRDTGANRGDPTLLPSLGSSRRPEAHSGGALPVPDSPLSALSSFNSDGPGAEPPGCILPERVAGRGSPRPLSSPALAKPLVPGALGSARALRGNAGPCKLPPCQTGSSPHAQVIAGAALVAVPPSGPRGAPSAGPCKPWSPQ